MFSLCEECFPDYGKQEILTIGTIMATCEACGKRDDRRNGGLRVHAFPSDPRIPKIKPSQAEQEAIMAEKKSEFRRFIEKRGGWHDV